MADFNFKGYDNFVLANKIESILSTKMELNRYMTMDNSLTGTPGMVKVVHKYVPSGQVDKLGRGDANTHYIDADYTSEEYRVFRTQGQFRFYDDDQMTDPTLIDTKTQGLSESMVNEWKAEAFAEFAKTEQTSAASNFDLADFADAIAIYANQFESQEGLFILCAQDLVPTLRKKLNDDLKYTEGYVKTGAIGAILGVPVYTTKALSKVCYIADSQAVTAFIKKDTQVESDRNIDTKLNMVVASKYAVIALTDGRRCVEMGGAQATPVTITTYTAAAKTIAGAATTGSQVQAYVNGKATGTAVTAASSEYTITATDNLASGDKVKVIATLNGKIKSIANVTVA